MGRSFFPFVHSFRVFQAMVICAAATALVLLAPPSRSAAENQHTVAPTEVSDAAAPEASSPGNGAPSAAPSAPA